MRGILRLGSGLEPLLRAIRFHQWAKNLLVFLPATAGHQIFNLDTVLSLAVAFLGLSLMASSVYIVNDALDLEADRCHPTKRLRPFASGTLSLRAGAGLSVLLFSVAIAVALYLPHAVLVLLLAYALISIGYSVYLKRQPFVDVFVLVALYELRLVVGHESTGVRYSYWFLMFFGFMFMSLALLKRYNETQFASAQKMSRIPGRAYFASEGPMLSTLGISCGVAAVVILALDINSSDIRPAYRSPYLLVAWCPIILFSFARVGCPFDSGNPNL